MSKRVPPTSGEPPVKKRAPRKISTDEICPDDLQALFGRNFQIARQKMNLNHVQFENCSFSWVEVDGDDRRLPKGSDYGSQTGRSLMALSNVYAWRPDCWPEPIKGDPNVWHFSDQGCRLCQMHLLRSASFGWP